MGIVSVCKVLNIENEGDGGEDMKVEIYFKGKIYYKGVSDICFNCVGKYYYCAFLEKDFSYLDIYREKEVGEFYIKLSKEKNFSGWEHFPE